MEIRPPLGAALRMCQWQIIAFAVLGFAAPALAQQVLVPPATFSPVPRPEPSELEGGTEAEGGTTLSAVKATLSPERLLQWGWEWPRCIRA